MLLLKIMGLFFIYAAVAYVPNTFFVIFNTYGFEIREARGFLVVFALILLGIYYFLIKYFLFNRRISLMLSNSIKISRKMKSVQILKPTPSSE